MGSPVNPPMQHKCGKCGYDFTCPGEPCEFSVMHNLCGDCMMEYAKKGEEIA